MMDSSLLKLKELLEASSEERKIPDCYALAYHYYQNKCYREALPLFKLLVANAPSEASYWKGLAATLQMVKEFEAAINGYAAAQALTKEKDPMLSLHAADCFFALNQVKEGFEALKAVEKEAKKKGNSSLLAHVRFMRQRWLKEEKNSPKGSL